MNASKVSIDRKLLKQTLSPEKKRNLRQKMFLELIDSKPAGTPIAYSEIARVCQFSGTGSAVGFVARLEKESIISVNKDGKTNSYSVNNAKTIKPVVTTPDVVEVVPERQTPRQLPAEPQLIRQAVLEFFWQTKSDSLHEFVEWLEQA